MEWERYGPAGFYPVHLGDILGGRYAVFRKLGTGSQCLVWLARDTSTSSRRFVALKVFKSGFDAKEIELDKLLPSPQGTHLGVPHLELTLDSFFIEDIQGSHWCRVVEPLGRTLGDILQDAEDERSKLNIECQPNMKGLNPMRVLKGDPWTIQFAKRACWQTLLGLDALHSHRIAHRDLHPANVCVAFSHNLSSLNENEIQSNVWREYQEYNKDAEASDTEELNEAGGAGGDDFGTGEEPDTDADLESVSSSDSEDSITREERLQDESQREKERKDIELQWRELELDPGDALAEPHSDEWNKANLLKSRDNIILRFRTHQKPLGCAEPRYIMVASSLQDGFDLRSRNSRLVLTDFGYACKFDQCEANPRNGLGLIDFMPPEWLLGLPTGPKGDIFSLGLLFFETVMLRRLVETSFQRQDPYPARPLARGRLVRDLAQRLGPLPIHMRPHLKDADDLLDAEGRALEFVKLKGMEGYYEPGEWGPDCFEWGDIWHQARFRKPLDMSDHDLEVFVGLLRQMMQWRPGDRPSTSELLRHEWFKDLQG